MADLKPCPFCGREAYSKIIFPCDPDGMEINMYVVGCKNCEIEFYRAWDEEAVIEAWNTRKPMEAVVAKLEAKRKEYEEAGKVFNGTHGSGIRLSYALKQGAILEAMEIVRNGGKE